MIAINLLPVREWKRREAVRRQISIFILSLLLLFCLLFAVGAAIQGKVSSQRAELQRLEKKKAKLAYVNKKIREVQNKSKEVETKFRAIEKLQQGRTRTVRVLDTVVTCLPIDRLWLTKLDLKGGRLSLAGIALDNHTIALFMRRLEGSSLFKKVRLGSSHKKAVQGHDLMAFDMKVQVAD